MAGKGQPKTGGRTAGTPNRFTQVVKDALLQSLQEISVGKQKGAVAYFKWLAKADPRAYAGLIGKTLPPEKLQVDVAVDAVVDIRDYTRPRDGDAETGSEGGEGDEDGSGFAQA